MSRALSLRPFRSLQLLCQKAGFQQQRLLSVTRNVKADNATTTTTHNLNTIKPPKRSIGGFRGGIIGFLFGFSIASAFAVYRLLDEYKQASAMLQASVLELQDTTGKMAAHIRRIEAIEKDLKLLEDKSANKTEVTKLRAEMKKIYDGLHIEFLDLRSHVWGLEQDLSVFSKKEGNIVKV